MQLHLIHAKSTLNDTDSAFFAACRQLWIDWPLMFYSPKKWQGTFIEIKPFSPTSGSWLSPFSKAQKQLAQQLLERSQPDDLFITTDWVFATLLSKTVAQKVIHFVDDFEPFPEATLLQRYLRQKERLITLCPSKTLADRINSHDPRCEATVVPLPYLSTNLPSRQSHQSFIVGTVNPLLPNQGIETVIQALAEVKEMIPQLKLVLIGDGPEKRRLLWLIQHLAVRDRVQMVFNQVGYERFITNFDVLIDANPTERGWNPVAIQALAQNIAMIAVETPLNRELIQHNKNGLLFEKLNVTMLSQHLINLYNHPDWLQHYTENGRQMIAGRYSLERFKEILLANY